MNLVDELHAVTNALSDAGVVYAVCGGVAVTIHGATRSTKDIDLLVAPSDVQRAVDIAAGLGYVFASLPMTFDAGTARERRVRRVSKIELPGSGQLDDRDDHADQDEDHDQDLDDDPEAGQLHRGAPTR